MRWIIDGNNVMGAGGDGWWNDPPAAAARLTQRIAEWCRTHEDPVTLVFDGAPQDRLVMLGGGNLEVVFATRRGRDAADDRIVELVDDRRSEGPDPEAAADRPRPVDGDPERRPELMVVTSDRGLRRRLPADVVTEGAGFFRGRIGAATGGPPPERPR